MRVRSKIKHSMVLGNGSHIVEVEVRKKCNGRRIDLKVWGAGLRGCGFLFSGLGLGLWIRVTRVRVRVKG